jgi:hypothetical protein
MEDSKTTLEALFILLRLHSSLVNCLYTLASRVAHGTPFWTHAHHSYSFQTFTCFEMCLIIEKGEVSYYWSFVLPVLESDSAGAQYSVTNFLLKTVKSKSKSYYDRRSVGQSVLESGTYLGPATNFSPFLNLILGCYGFADMVRPLWREVGSVVFSYCWASPAQSFSGRSLTGLMTIFYYLNFWDSSNLEGRFPVFISPRNTLAQFYP